MQHCLRWGSELIKRRKKKKKSISSCNNKGRKESSWKTSFLKYVAHMKGREFPRHIQASAITATHQRKCEEKFPHGGGSWEDAVLVSKATLNVFFVLVFFVVAYFVIKTQPCHNAARIAPSEKNTRLEAGFSRLRLTWEKNKISIMTLQGLSAASAAACTLYIRRTGAEWPRGLSDMTQTVLALFKIVRSEKKEVRFVFWSELASIDRRLQRNCAQTESPKQQLGSSY